MEIDGINNSILSSTLLLKVERVGQASLLLTSVTMACLAVAVFWAATPCSAKGLCRVATSTSVIMACLVKAVWDLKVLALA